ncbi:MAG: hypothetical protein VB013_15465 [Anaerolineaceae bacterium]|nr:hypothetical protein [Anaerolineaceae bacterium]
MQKRTISGFARFIAVILSILLTIVLIAAFLQVTLSQTVFSANFIKNVMAEQKVYETLPQVVTGTLLESVSGSEDSTLKILSQIPTEQLNQWIASVMPQDYLQAQTSEVVDAAEAFINLDTYILNLQFDLTPVKANLTSEASQTALNSVLDSLPDCTADQLTNLMASALQGNLSDISIPMCKPDEPLLSIVRSMLGSTVGGLANSIPDSITVGGEAVQTQINQFVSGPQYRTYYLVKRLLEYSIWAALGLVLLIVLFTLRSRKVMFTSLGVPMILTGIVGLGCAALAYLSLFSLSSFPLITHLSGVMSGLVVRISYGILQKTSLVALLVALGVFILGLLLTISAGKIKE